MKSKQMSRFQTKVVGILFPLFLGSLAVLPLLQSCLGLALVRETGYIPGTYEGKGRGYRGPIYVRLQTSYAEIEDIIITGHQESIYPGVAAMEELLEAVLEIGSTDLDAVSGATYSSRGFLEAVEDALAKAVARTSE